MAIGNYDFIKYDKEQIEHIDRHLEGSDVAGSHFKRDAFSDSKSLIDFALSHIQEYDGSRLVKEIECEKIIGYDSLVSLDNLPDNAKVVKEPRGRNEYLVNIVEGVDKTPTRQMVIVAGPLKENKHGFYTIFPGENASPFPVTREQLTEFGYEGNALENAIEQNKQYEKFWDSHGFVREK